MKDVNEMNLRKTERKNNLNFHLLDVIIFFTLLDHLDLVLWKELH